MHSSRGHITHNRCVLALQQNKAWWRILKKAFSLINWLSDWTTPAAIYLPFNIFLPLSSITAYTHSCALCEAQWQRRCLSLPSDTLPFFTPGGSLRLSECDGVGCGSIEDTAGPSRLKCYDQSRDYGSKSLAEFWLWNRDHSCMNKHQYHKILCISITHKRGWLHAQRSTHRLQVKSEWTVWCAKITVLAFLAFCAVGTKLFHALCKLILACVSL